MVGRKLALALGALLILAVVSESNELKVDENAKIEETRVASAHLNNNKHTKKIVLPSAVQTLVHRVLKTKDDGDVESGRKKGENADGTERDLESRAWFTNMQVKKDNIFEEDVGPEPRAAGKPKSGKKKKKTTKKKAGSRRRKRNRGKGKGGRSRGRGKGEFSIRFRWCNWFHVTMLENCILFAFLLLDHKYHKTKLMFRQSSSTGRSPGKGHSGGYGGKGRSKGRGTSTSCVLFAVLGRCDFISNLFGFKTTYCFNEPMFSHLLRTQTSHT